MNCNNAVQTRNAADMETANHPSGVCGAANGNYKVTVQTDGSLIGHAWSSNVGWIKFGGLGTVPTNFPNGTGSYRGNARLVANGSGYRLEGWARACAGTISGDCSSMVSRTDGWDGWISLGGSSHSITLDGDLKVNANAFAWGHSVVGWMRWDAFGISPGVNFNPPPGINSFTITPDEVTLNAPTPSAPGSTNTVTVNWSASGVDSCTASNNNADPNWTGPIPTSGTESFVPVRGVTKYAITCSKAGMNLTEEETITALPDLIIGPFSINYIVTDPVTGLSTVNFIAEIDGLQYTTSTDSIPWSITFGGSTETGNLTGGNPTNRTFTVPNVLPGDHPPAILEIDSPTIKANEAIVEDLPNTPADEDVEGNTKTATGGSIPIGAPPVNVIEFKAEPATVRYNAATTIRWELSAPYDATCQIRGPGVSTDITITAPAVPGGFGTAVGTTQTSNLTNTALYTLSCTAALAGIDAGAPRTITVQVTPEVQEI